MNEYQVSLIIPVYNVENYIRESLLSALGQTFGSIEYILVDDCGTDHSMEIACSIVDGHPRRQDVRIVSHDRNRGLSAALYSDISAEDTDAQKAARWAVEQGLMDAAEDGKFHPAFPVSKLRVCLTWEKAKQKGLFDKAAE